MSGDGVAKDDGDTLIYDAASDEFRPAPPPSGGGGGLTLLEQHTASSSATLDFTTCISATYDEYMIEFVGIIPATNSVSFVMRMGTGAGPTYDTGANYGWAAFTIRAAATGFDGVEGGTTAMRIGYSTTIDNTSTGSLNGTIRLYDPQSTSLYKRWNGIVSMVASGGFRVVDLCEGSYESTTAVTAVRFYMSSGNISSGTIRIYGVAK